MRLLNVSTARSIWLFDVEALNPRGLDLIPILASIQAKYRFQKYPTKIEELYPANGGIQFAHGAFELADQQIAIAGLTIYKDGIVADTRHSTDASDAFIQDALLFAAEHHGLTFDPATVRSKGYVSDLVVTTEASIETLTEKLRAFAALLSADAKTHQLIPAGIRFSSDPAGPGTPVQFIFERRLGAAFEEKRYYSQAPFPTERHLHLLDALERILTEK